MGKKTNDRTPATTAASKGAEPAKTKPAPAKTAAKKKLPLAKAATAVAAVALAAGKAIASRKKTAAKKTEPKTASAAKPRSKRSVAAGSNGSNGASFTQDDIALRAYFLSERRKANGWPADSNQDWVDAEQELTREARESV
jgi:hypothetical protein